MKKTTAKKTATKETKTVAKKRTQKKKTMKKVPSSLPPSTVPANTQPDNWNERWQKRKAEQAAMIAADPKAAMQDAYQRIDYGFEVLCELVGKRSLLHVLKYKDGSIAYSSDEAAMCFCARFSPFIDEAAKFARSGQRDIIGAVWRAAKQLTELIHDLAFDKEQARELEWYGRRSLFLPSLRARTETGFSHDFQAVANAIHLSENCLCHMEESAGHKLDCPITRLVAEIVESIGWIQDDIRTYRDSYQRGRKLYSNAAYMARLPESDAVYARNQAAMTEDEYLMKAYYVRQERLHYDKLPPLTKRTANEWFEKAVKQELVFRFPTLIGSRLYRGLKGQKDYKKRDDLKRRGKSALKNLARPDPQNPLSS